jgi:hypothetical protein
MKIIYKYPLPLAFGPIFIDMPIGATILSFQMQLDVPTIWALVDTDKPSEPRRFVIVRTGEKLTFGTYEWTYIGTVLTSDHEIVAHLFEHTGGVA